MAVLLLGAPPQRLAVGAVRHSVAKLVDRLVQIGLDRHRDRRRLDQGIKELLGRL